MKFTLSIPVGDITPGAYQTPVAVRDMATALEAAGADAAYVTDHPAPDARWLHANGHDALDPFTALAFVAAATDRLMVHTNILVLPYRNPFLVAKAAATLQVLSGGRLILGVGAGYQPTEFAALGVDFKKRGKLFDEALEVLQLAWSNGPTVYQGIHFSAAGNPRPVPDPLPPVWIGGGSPAAIARAARWGDGWCPFLSSSTQSQANRDSGIQSIAELGIQIGQLQELRAELGRTGPFDVAIGPLAPHACQTAEGAETMLETLDQLGQAGATWARVDLPHASRQNFLENIAWFGEAVIATCRV